jgi:hypothetical protein
VVEAQKHKKRDPRVKLRGYITTDNLRSFHDLFPVMVKITSDTSFCFILLPKG